MTETMKKGDFIELDYTGKTSEGLVFDTTIKAVAEQAHLQAHRAFKPVIICLGEGHLVPGLDQALEGQPLGKHTIALKEPFGKKNAKLLQLIPRKVFNEQEIVPQVGLEITVDNQQGIIRSVSGGRIIVDFNHPLASRDITYEVDMKRLVIDQKEQVQSLLGLIGLPVRNVAVSQGKAVIIIEHELPSQIIDLFSKDIVRLTGVTQVTFVPEKKSVEKEQVKQ